MENITIYLPTKKEKEEISYILDEMFLTLCKLKTFEQRVFAMRLALETFNEAHHIRIQEVELNEVDKKELHKSS